MASATSATRVILPKAVTKSLHANSRCSLPFTTLQPFALGRSEEISASVSLFGGMAQSSTRACLVPRHYAVQAPCQQQRPFRQNGPPRVQPERFFVECAREFHYRRGFL